ncbi:hypothetical protein T440DRAFT_465344 [Plenodomus tracheiphilus IPT5]|uniref:SAP domain-containing protein n=1 Tax=Plenodomus tracheiphilus IPT5 TaxID=1408161 RepID=A0A6A7BG82_9PLEO|nr:hypothetical protein T440DRAFT_465344 [Plenodomus tracheiphilus IPT5]
MSRKPNPLATRKPPAYTRFKVVDLVAKLSERGLSTTGRRAELVERLQEDDKQKAAEVETQHGTGTEPPRETTNAPSDDSKASADDYQGVYTGPSVVDGRFHHFVRIVSESQVRRGYWRFASIEDDHRAYACGLSTPEDVLVEQDRGQASLDDIILRWMPGSDQTDTYGLSLNLIGPASSHLNTLYELRTLLGQPMSFRGQIPAYPISEDSRIKQYWIAKVSNQQLKALNAAKEVDSSAPITPGRAPSSSNAQAPTNLTSKLSSQLHRTRTPQQSHTHDTQKAQESFKLSDDLHLRLSSRPTVSPFIPPARAPSPCTPGQMASANALRVTNNLAALDAHNHHTANEFERLEELFAPLVIDLDSLGDPGTLPDPERPETPDFLKGVLLPPPPVYSPPLTRESSLPDESEVLNEPISIPSSPPLSLPPPLPPLPLRSAQQASPSPCAHESKTEFDAEQREYFEQAETDIAAICAANFGLAHYGNTIAPVDGTLRPASLSPAPSTSKNKKEDTELSDGDPIQLPTVSGNAAFGPVSAVEQNPEVMDWEVEGEAIQSTSASPTRADLFAPPLTEYPDIPCMDCGWMEAEGHSYSCHVGSLKFSDNLTVLDHRRLADAVENLDPGPWTTHFDPYPTPSPEDSETQIRGMADIIRNEDTYKDDVELHELPDAMMVLLWAFKTLPNSHVVKE